MSYTRGLDQRIFEMSSWNENEVEIHLKFYSVLNVQNVLDRSFMACLGVICLHWARTMFPDCFCPTEGFFSLVLRSRQAAHKTDLFVNHCKS